MQKKISYSIFSILLFFSVTQLKAKTWDIDKVMKDKGLTFTKAVQFLINDSSAKDGDVIVLNAGTYKIESRIVLSKDLDFVGKGMYKTIIWKSVEDPKGFTFACNTKNITFKNLTINGGNKTAKIAIVNNESVSFINVRFINATNAIHGDANIGGLQVIGCYFTKSVSFRGVSWNRFWAKAKTKSLKKISIINSRFEGIQPAESKTPKFAISMDAGNEDINKGGLDVVTDLNGMLIEGCVFKEDFSGGIAFAQVKNVIIRNNTFIAGKEQKRNAIHIEDTSSNIKIQVKNKFYCNDCNGKPLIFISTGNGTTPETEISQNIEVTDNIFSADGGKHGGKASLLLNATYAKNIRIEGNETCRIKTTNSNKIIMRHDLGNHTIKNNTCISNQYLVVPKNKRTTTNKAVFSSNNIENETDVIGINTVAENSVLVFSNVDFNQNYTARIFDLSGKKVYEGILNNTNTMNTHVTAKGFYVIELFNSQHSEAKKIFKVYFK